MEINFKFQLGQRVSNGECDYAGVVRGRTFAETTATSDITFVGTFKSYDVLTPDDEMYFNVDESELEAIEDDK